MAESKLVVLASYCQQILDADYPGTQGGLTIAD
jgi:hypothetical protein